MGENLCDLSFGKKLLHMTQNNMIYKEKVNKIDFKIKQIGTPDWLSW